MIKNMYGINYKLPEVTLLKESGIGVAELAARTCYDSFDNSENECIRNANNHLDLDSINNIEDSQLLNNLSWVHHHHSIIEHATLSYLVKGTSRGVLQEHARHRLQSISVRSTRYTMGPIINAYVAATFANVFSLSKQKKVFFELLKDIDFLILSDNELKEIEYDSIFNKIEFQRRTLGNKDFLKLAIAKSSLDLVSDMKSPEILFNELQSGKNKRNVGDAFKHIVSDNWKVDMIISFNIRSLKNYFGLRDSGAAWFQIQWLANAIKEATPIKYLKLIDKKYKDI
jgi:thymidylate synthase (FAD)